MKSRKRNFTFFRAEISDENDNFLANVKIWEHDAKEGYIEVQPSPALTAGKLCNVLIRTVPKPYTCKGRIRVIRGRTIIMFMGHTLDAAEKETRQSPRFKMNILASIEGSVYDNKIYPLHTNEEVTVTDISRGGGRLHACYGSARLGDKLLVRLNEKAAGDSLLLMEVVSHKDVPNEYSSYGCRFIAGDKISLNPVMERIERDYKPPAGAWSNNAFYKGVS